MAFQKSFDELLNGLLTDYHNQFPDADLSQGSLLFIKSACLASALWGLYQHQEYVARQIFPDTADVAHLEHHAALRGLTRTATDTDAELLARLLDYLRRPPAGGNQYDYIKWALEVDGVNRAYCLPLHRGDGTVDVLIMADPVTGSEIPQQTLLDQVAAHIETVRPVTANVQVRAPVISMVSVTLRTTGTARQASIAEALTAYLNAMEPGQTLYRSQLIALALAGGAADATLDTPAGDVIAAEDTYFRPHVITVL